MAKSLVAEQQLRDALLEYSDPDDPAAEVYLHEWGMAVQYFNPADIPTAACDNLPTLQQNALREVPFSYPTPIPVTQWMERAPRQQCKSCPPTVTHCSQLIRPEQRCAGLL